MLFNQQYYMYNTQKTSHCYYVHSSCHWFWRHCDCYKIHWSLQIIRIYREREGRIEKSVPRIAVSHHEACRVMTNGDHEGRVFLSYPHTNNGFFFLLTTVFIYLFQNKLPEVPEYAKKQFHMMTLLDVLGNTTISPRIVRPDLDQIVPIQSLF